MQARCAKYSVRINLLTEDDLPPTDYGYWISDRGDFYPVERFGHAAAAKRLFPEWKRDEPYRLINTFMLKSGWISCSIANGELVANIDRGTPRSRAGLEKVIARPYPRLTDFLISYELRHEYTQKTKITDNANEAITFLRHLPQHAVTESVGAYQRFDYWFCPKTGEEIRSRDEHVYLVLANPARFGITPEEMAEVRKDPEFEEEWNSPLIRLVTSKGWVRVKVGGTMGNLELSLQGSNWRDLQKAAKHFADRYAPTSLAVDIDCDHHASDWHDILKQDEIARFIKFGRLPARLTEAPLGDLELIGDKNREGSFGADDMKAIQNPKWQLKTRNLFAKIPFNFNVYLYNGPGGMINVPSRAGPMNHYAKNANNISQWTGHYTAQAFTKMAGVLPTDYRQSITVCLTNNEGEERVPLTPWMVAHRIIHALLATPNEAHRKDADIHWQGIEAFRQCTSMMSWARAVVESFADKANPEGRFKENSKKADELYRTLGTMRSAREGKIERGGEFAIELMTQYLITGKITINIPELDYDGDLEMMHRGTMNQALFEEELRERVEMCEIKTAALFKRCVGSIFVF